MISNKRIGYVEIFRNTIALHELFDIFVSHLPKSKDIGPKIYQKSCYNIETSMQW